MLRQVACSFRQVGIWEIPDDLGQNPRPGGILEFVEHETQIEQHRSVTGPLFRKPAQDVARQR